MYNWVHFDQWSLIHGYILISGVTICIVGKLFIPCNERVQNKWTEWAQSIMLLVIEPQSPESGLPSLGKNHISNSIENKEEELPD